MQRSMHLLVALIGLVSLIQLAQAAPNGTLPTSPLNVGYYDVGAKLGAAEPLVGIDVLTGLDKLAHFADMV